MIQLRNIPRETFLNHIFSGFNYNNIGALSSTSKEYYVAFMGAFKKLWERRINSLNSPHYIYAPMTFFEFMGGINQLIKKYRVVEDLYVKNKHLFMFDPYVVLRYQFSTYFSYFIKSNKSVYGEDELYREQRLKYSIKKVEDGYLEALKEIRSMKIARCGDRLFSACCYIMPCICAMFAIFVIYGSYVLSTQGLRN